MHPEESEQDGEESANRVNGRTTEKKSQHSVSTRGELGGFPGGSNGKASAYNAGNLDSNPGSGESPGAGNGNPLQYSCLKNHMDRGSW